MRHSIYSALFASLAATSAHAAVIEGEITGFGVNGAGNIKSIKVDLDGDNSFDKRITFATPSEDLTDRIENAIERGQDCITFNDENDNDTLDGDETIDLQDCPQE